MRITGHVRIEGVHQGEGWSQFSRDECGRLYISEITERLREKYPEADIYIDIDDSHPNCIGIDDESMGEQELEKLTDAAFVEPKYVEVPSAMPSEPRHRRTPHYYMVRERIDGWNVVSHGSNRDLVDKEAREALQDEHQGLWLGEYSNCRLITRTQAIRIYRFSPEILDELEN